MDFWEIAFYASLFLWMISVNSTVSAGREFFMERVSDLEVRIMKSEKKDVKE